jgi:hypothetical protein
MSLEEEELDLVEADDDCMCEFPSTCGGLGVLDCDGCGGDFCICICGGGSIDCPGCDECPDDDDFLDDD